MTGQIKLCVFSLVKEFEVTKTIVVPNLQMTDSIKTTPMFFAHALGASKLKDQITAYIVF
jgi:hypothetical protein